MSHAAHKSPREKAFSHYLRTGQRLPEDAFITQSDVELKFNPYHDPRNGQFTFAPGGARSPANVIISERRNAQPRQSSGARNASRQAATVPARPYLSARHNEILDKAARYQAERGTVERWSGTGDKERFKAQWVRGHREAIKAAAKANDIPPALLGAVAYTQAGGDGVEDDFKRFVRSDSGRHVPVGGKIGILLNRRSDHTSFGPLNIQERRAAQILGYGDISTMDETARRTLVPTTKDPDAAIFMAAQHLSDLRDQDFRGVAGKNLTRDQLRVIATRYNQGPELDLEKMNTPKNIDRGNTYMATWNRVTKLLD